MYFAAITGAEMAPKPLWKTDGTPKGTVMICDVLRLGDHVYFTASDAKSGLELWRSDGTPGGTRVADLLPGQHGSLPRELFVASGKLYFYTMSRPGGREVWEVDPGAKEGDGVVVFR